MQKLVEELLGSLVRGARQESVAWCDFHDAAGFHIDNAIRDLARKSHLMGDAQHRHTVLSRAALDMW